MTNTHKLIDEVIDDFNFEKVLIAMHALDWKWRDPNSGQMSIPDIKRMKAMARNLLFSAIEDKVVCSGGFQARYEFATDQEPESFELAFILAESTTHND